MQEGAAGDGGSSPVEPPDNEGNEGYNFAETDPSGRYGRFDQVLGRGAFKTVYKAFDTQEGTEVAWNQVKVGELVNCKDSKEERDRLFAEIRVLKQLKHKNIMTFYDSWLDPKTMSINFITELFTSGTLRQYRKRHKHIDEEVLKRWAWQILCGLVYLHGHTPPIIHRDLKCDNIFINGSDGTVKIGDLGLATMLRNRTAPQSVLGTPEFMAPELYEEEYDDRVDVYSFGMCMLELATMEYPYAECKNAAQIYRKVSLGVRPAGLQKVTNQELADFVNLCISTRDQRPRSRMLLKHPYFDSIRPPGQLASKSQVGLAAMASQPDSMSDYGGSTSGLSRSSSTTAEVAMAAGPAAGGGAGGLPMAPSQPHHPSYAAAAAAHVPVPPPAGSAGGGAGPPSAGSAAGISRTVSAATEGAHSDAASLKSHRSNVSDLTSVLTDITEEGEGADNGEDMVGQHQQQQQQQWEEGGVAAASRGAPPAATAAARPPSGAPTPAAGSAVTSPRGAPSSPARSPPAAAASPASSKPPSPMSTSKPGSPSVEEELIMEMEEEEHDARCCMGVAEGAERQFLVVGKYQEDNDTFSLRLRICEPGGQVRTVEFEFDISSDTAISVASEMVEDLQLSQEDAAAIATAIRDEIANLTTNLEEQLSLSLEQASAALQEGLFQSSAALANSSPRPSYMEQAGRLLAERGGAASAEPAQLESAAVPAPPAQAAPPPLPAPPAASAIGGGGQLAALAAVPPPFAQQEAAPALPAAGPGSATPTASLITAKSFGSASSLHSVASSHNSGETALTAQSYLSLGSGEVPLAAPAAVVGLGAATGPLRPPSPADRVTSPPPLPPGQPLAAAAAAAAGVPSPASHPAISRLLRSSSASGAGFGPSAAVGAGAAAGGAGYGRSATMPVPAPREREPPVGASPGAGQSLPSSGALSPSSGVLSPQLSHDKRIPLNKLFENLQDLAALRGEPGGMPGAEKPAAAPGILFPSGGSGGVSSAGISPRQSLPGAAGGADAGGSRLPPLPAPAGQHSRPLTGSLSGSALADVPVPMVAQDAGLMRPASEACLAGLLERFDPFNLTSGPAQAVQDSLLASSTSAPAASGGLAAACAAAERAVSPPQLAACHSAACAMLAPDTVAQLAEATALREQVAAGQQLSAPSSKATSRDTSPMRTAGLSPSRSPIRSPTRAQQQAAANAAAASFACDAAAALLANGIKKGKTDADKEALRKQAADAMKAVELRSLNLLEGGLLAGKTVRGTPMAATKLTGLATAASAPAAAPIAAAAAPAACPAGAPAAPPSGTAVQPTAAVPAAAPALVPAASAPAAHLASVPLPIPAAAGGGSPRKPGAPLT